MRFYRAEHRPRRAAAPSEPARVRQRRAGARELSDVEADLAERRHLDARPGARWRRRLERCMTLGCAGHGVSTTARTSRPAGARRLDGEQRVVDGPQPRPRGHHQRPAEVDGEVADRVARG